jgi:hypothetical protein
MMGGKKGRLLIITNQEIEANMNTFQQFLEEKCEEQESDTINKDNYEAVGDRWFENLDVQELIDFGEEYGKYVAYETLSKIQDELTIQTLKAHDELKIK